jgi:hypothetical protein
LFWLLAAIVTAIGLGDIFVSQMRGSTALLVSVTELVFGLALTIRAMGANKSAARSFRRGGRSSLGTK